MTINLPGYKILRTLGKGGMATVYLAEQVIFEREVALKVMAKHLAEDPSFGQRFMREARIVSQLVHPNIVTVHDVGVHDGYYYLSMQYIDGQDLKQARRSLSMREKITAVRDIAKALDYAGSKGYVHRDIKPENILFHTSDGRAVLTDFGIARAAESDLAMTQTGTAIGTPHYMSPEQAKGLAVDHRADLYSLGVVFYLLLAGRLPFDAESAVAIGIKHIAEKVPPLPRHLSSLQPLVNKLMAKKVDNRFQNAKELIAALDELDLHQLEHVERMAAEAMAMRAQPGDPDAPTKVSTPIADTITAPTIERALSDEELQASLDDRPHARADDDHEAEAEYTVVFEEDPSATSWFPWIAGLLVCLTVAGGVFYQQRPDIANRWLQQGLGYADEAALTVEGWLFDVEPDASQPLVPKTGENVPQFAERESEPDRPQGPQALSEVESTSGSVGSGGELEQALAPVESVNGASPSAVDEVHTKSPAELDAEQTLERLKEHFLTEPAVLSELVQAYKNLISLAPSNLIVAQEFDDLRALERAKVIELAADDKVDLARAKLQQYQLIFDGVSQQDILDLESELEQQVQVNGLLEKAQTAFEADALTRPDGQNALSYYQQVLELQPDNLTARNGVDKISTRLLEYAKRNREQGRYASAKTFVDKALALTPESNEGQEEKRRVEALLNRQNKVLEAVRKGKQALENGDYFSPQANSAYAHYTAALMIDPNHQPAQDGLVDAQKLFRGRVFGLLELEEFDSARALLERALKDSPSYQPLASLQAEVEQAISDLIYAKQPRLLNLLVSGQPISDLSATQAQTISADRSIYIGFRFENFQSETAVIQAELTDGAGALQIAQVPVVVTGQSGVAEFSIDRAVEGFPNGSYTISMRLGDQMLHTSLFRVSN